ncbi:MAG TPA: TonB-dependent receptor [Thermoanaerobaculia bacterium]|jgi:outer membrane receptor protein involved in Fe transport
MLSLILLLAFQSRLLDSGGRPIAGAQISVVDQSVTARTDAEGSFTLEPEPRLPATLIIVGSNGELFPPLYVQTATNELRVAEVYRETVSVSTGATPNIERTPASAPVLVGAQEIEQRRPQRIAEAIATTPGVSLRGEGPPAVPVVRGLAGGRTLLLIDDARIVAERRAGPSATFIDPQTLASIEIARGPGSVAYGSDALGGVVHLRTRDPIPGQRDFRYSASCAFGAANFCSAAADVSFDVFGGALLASLHGRSASDAEDAEGNVIANSQYRDRGALLRFVRDTSWGRMRAGFMTSLSRDVGAPSSDTVLTIYPDERASLLTFATDVDDLGLWNLAQLRASLGSYSITTNRVRTTGVESAAVKARDASFRFSGDRFGGRSRLVTGIDFVSRFDLRASPSLDDADRYDAGAFASWTGDLTPRLQFGAGGRVDAVSSRSRGSYFGDRSRDDVAVSGFGAVTAGPFRDVTATLQIASGYREPTLSDRYFRGISGRGFVTGNPDLEPERSRQIDGALRWSRGGSRVALYAYDYRIRNLVERYRAGNDFQFRNRGEADVRGLELETTNRLMENLELQFGAAVARGEVVGSEDNLDDIAPPTVHASLRWALPHASAFFTVSHYADDDRPGPVETARPAYTELDIGTGWRLTPHFEVRVVVRNATNEQHFGSADAVAAFAPGRSIIIGINR